MQVAVGSICEVTAGQSAPQDSDAFGSKGKPFIRAGSLERLLEGAPEDECERITDDVARRYRLRLFPSDTILFAKSGMSAKIGRVYRLKQPAYLTSHLAAVIPGERVSPSYLQRWFEKHPPSRLIPNEAYPSIRTSEIAALTLELPHGDEQRRIAGILDKADAVQRKRKEAIALTEQLLRSTFLGMFGDPVTNPKCWPVKPLGGLLSFLTSGSRGWAQYYAEVGETFLRIQNVGRDRLDLTDVASVSAPTSAEARRTETSPGDVLLSITADLGRTAVVPGTLERAFINQHLAILRPNGVNSEYLSSFLASEGGQRQINRRNKGGVKAGLNFDDIRSIEVALPPVPVQDAFGLTKTMIRQLETHQLQARAVDEDLFNSLLARAFSPAEARC